MKTDGITSEDGKLYFSISFEGNDNFRMKATENYLNVLPISWSKRIHEEENIRMAYPRSITGCRPYSEDTTYLIYWPHRAERSIFEFEPADNPKCEFYIRLKSWNLGRDALKKNNATIEDIEKYEGSYLAVDANM